MINRALEPLSDTQALALTFRELERTVQRITKLEKDLEVIRDKAWRIRQYTARAKTTPKLPLTKLEIDHIYELATQIEEMIHDPASN